MPHTAHSGGSGALKLNEALVVQQKRKQNWFCFGEVSYSLLVVLLKQKHKLVRTNLASESTNQKLFIKTKPK